MSVLEKAQQLATRARTHSDGAKERDQRERIATALLELAKALQDLRGAVDAYVAARDAGVPVAELPVQKEFVNASAEGLPSPQSLVAAKKRVTTLADQARDAVAAQWREWAQAKLDGANPGRMRRLGIQHRRPAEAVQKQLRDTVGARPVRAGDVATFREKLAELERMLATISEDDPVVLLLNRIRTGRVTLGDLTTDELDALRAERSIAGQVFLQTT